MSDVWVDVSGRTRCMAGGVVVAMVLSIAVCAGTGCSAAGDDVGVDSGAHGTSDGMLDAGPGADTDTDTDTDAGWSDSTTDAGVDGASDAANDTATDGGHDASAVGGHDASTSDASYFSAIRLSKYAELAIDTSVTSSSVLLETTIELAEARAVLVSSDGRYFPLGSVYARVFITIDGHQASSDAALDWRGSVAPAQHSYNTVGAEILAPGTHVVQLIAEASSTSSGFVVGLGSNLSVMVEPAREVHTAEVASDTQAFDLSTDHLVAGDPAPHISVLSTLVDIAASDSGSGSDSDSDSGSGPGAGSGVDANSEPVVALAAGNVFKAGASGAYGDAMTGLFVDGQNVGNNQSQWAVTDIARGAELRAPVSNHAYFTGLMSGPRVISFDASEFPWGNYNNWTENGVNFSVGARSRLVVLYGGLSVSGSAPTAFGVHDWWARVGVGSNTGNEPPADQPVLLAEGALTVPEGHHGVVMFLGKSRVQGDGANTAVGDFYCALYLEVDGVTVGSLGVQEFRSGQSISQRTISTSYLAADDRALRTGPHVVRLMAKTVTRDATVPWAFMHQDLNLLWFD